MSVLITICARGGSKGIPGKNIKLLNQKPLIGYTIEIAIKFQEHINDTDIVLSTDSEEIKQVSGQFGLNTNYTRPDFLSGDSVGKIDAITDVLRYYSQYKSKKYDYILDLDVTSPLRNISDLLSSFDILKKNHDALNLFSVSLPGRNPYYNMVEQKENGYYTLVKKLDKPYLSRQSAPIVYDMNASFYFFRNLFFEQKCKTVITERTMIYLVPHICFDLDRPLDFDFLTYLIENNKLDFKF